MIHKVIQTIEKLFDSFNRDSIRFTVDYDDTSDGLYCHYTPYANDSGYAVTDDLLIVGDTSRTDLQLLQAFLKQNNISSRSGCEWYADWGLKE